MYIERDLFITDWLTQLWRLRNYLPSANWRPRKASGSLPVQTQMHENQKSPRLSPKVQEVGKPVTKDREDGCLSISKRANSPFLQLFVRPCPQ